MSIVQEFEPVSMRLPGLPLGRSIWDRVTSFVLPVFTICAAMFLWEWLSIAFEVPLYLVPKPSDFLHRFYTDFHAIRVNTVATASVILGGFLMGAGVAIPLAYAVVSFASFQRGLYPLIVFLQIIPKTITAPLFIVWFGIGITPKLILTMLMTFFPILVDSMSGFRSVDPRLYHLSRSMGASGHKTFRYIQVPAAMPYIFAGLKTASVYAVTAVMVTEFVGSNEGLGYLMLRAAGFMDTTLMFTCVIAMALLGLAFNLLVVSLEWFVMPWTRKY